VAGLMGVDSNKVIIATFALGAALAAVAGVMWGANYASIQFSMGFLPGLKAFCAAVLGGIGNIYGAMLGGIVLGMIESLGAGYIGDLTGGFLGSHYQDIFAFVVLIIGADGASVRHHGRARGGPCVRRRHHGILNFDTSRNPRAYASMALLLALLVIFPFFAHSSATPGCASPIWRCCTSCWRWA
jgi:hypothetical protein